MTRPDPAYREAILEAAAAAVGRPGVEPLVASYRAHWQLSLDGNQPSAVREHHRAETRRFQKELFFLLASSAMDCLELVFRVPPDRSSDV